MRVTVDQQLCREYANCVIESPDVFDIDDVAGKAVVLVGEPDASLHAEISAAVSACPVRAITIAN